MAVDTPHTGAVRGTEVRGVRSHADETKAAFKTTEFVAYIAVVAAVLVAGLVIKGGGTDEFQSPTVWLYVVILTFGYMLSRGIAKSGSRHRDHDHD
jgi:hypothetical protein